MVEVPFKVICKEKMNFLDWYCPKTLKLLHLRPCCGHVFVTASRCWCNYPHPNSYGTPQGPHVEPLVGFHASWGEGSSGFRANCQQTRCARDLSCLAVERKVKSLLPSGLHEFWPLGRKGEVARTDVTHVSRQL